jgi:hypothetical protein
MKKITSGLLITAALVLPVGAETPHIFWASDPVRPDETVLVQGSEFEGAKVEVQQLGRDKKWSAIPIAQGSESSLKFIVPANWQQGVYALKVTGKDGKASKEWLINSPDVWWTQGDEGESATPGGWLRTFGKSLNFGGKTVLRLTPESGRSIELAATKADAFAASFDIPSDLKPGMYQAAMHNGLGGDAAWREIANVRIDPPVAWPQEVFSVLDFYGPKAVQDAIKSRQRYAPFMDRMEGIRAALAKAKANGGGIVYFPAGKYLITELLEIPPRTVIRGAGQRMSLLWWGEKGLENKFYADVNEDPKKAGERLGLKQKNAMIGTAYGVEDIGLFVPYAYDNAVTATGRFRMKNVMMRVDRGWLLRGAEAMEYAPDSWLVRTTENYHITDCDLLASKTSIWPGRYGWIARNQIGANTSLISMMGTREIILEENDFKGTAPRAYMNITGAGRHIYYAKNNHHSPYGPQAICHFTSDLSPACFQGRGAKVDGTKITLPEDPVEGNDMLTWPKWSNTNDPVQVAIWKHPVVAIQEGRGAGQWRDVTSFDGREWKIDRPFEVAPDENSFLIIFPGIVRWLMVGNSYHNYDWVVPGYDVGIDVICAETKTWNLTEMLNYGGERFIGAAHPNYAKAIQPPDPRQLPLHTLSARGGDVVKPGMESAPGRTLVLSPNWYFQYFDNDFREGNTILRTSGGMTKQREVPVTRCTVHRRHRFFDDNFGKMVISQAGNRDVVVENCEFMNPNNTLSVEDASHVLLRNNRFAAPGATGYTGSGLKDALILPPLKP